MFIKQLKEVIIDKCDGSQKEFSKMTGIPESTISHWLTRNIKPTYIQIVKICDTFNLSADYLLGRESEITGNIEIIGEQLSKDEKEVLAIYRTLNVDEKTAFLSMIKSIATLKNK